jgi:hypothetical protein
LLKKKTAVAKQVEQYKITKENLLRSTVIIRSGFAFDAPSRTLKGSGECCARALFLCRLTAAAAEKMPSLISPL